MIIINKTPKRKKKSSKIFKFQQFLYHVEAHKTVKTVGWTILIFLQNQYQLFETKQFATMGWETIWQLLRIFPI